MTSGTKVLLALIGLFVGILVLYYGFLMPNTPPGAGGLVRDPVMQTAPADTPALAEVTTPAAAPSKKVTARQVKPFAAAETGTLDRNAAANRADSAAPGSAAVRGADARTAGEAAGTVAGSLSGAAQRAATARAMRGGAESAPAGQDTGQPAPATRTPSTPPPAVAERAPEYTRYVVRDGDTLTSIAERWFGDHRKWDLIAGANSVDPNRLKVGQTLRLPPRDVARRPIQRSQNTTHTVRSGDSLFSIAQAYYGDRAAWKKLYAANRDRIGADPDALRVGMKIRVP